MKKTAAGLIVFTKIPHEGLVAILSRRGEFDYEEFKPEKYAHLYEATASGAIESGEHMTDGLLREVEEEIGTAAAKLIRNYIPQFHMVAHLEHNYPNFPVSIYTYAVFIPHFPIKIIKPHRSSEGIRLVSAQEVAKVEAFIRNDEKKGPMKDDSKIWMHGDQLEGLKKGFELFKHL